MAFTFVALLESHALLVLVVAVFFPFFSLLLLSGKKCPSCDTGGKRLPPSPRGLPLVGHLLFLGALPHRTLRSLAAAHGPVMLLRFGSVPTVVISSVAGAQEALKTRDHAFASRPRLRRAERLFTARDIAFTPTGEFWRQARRVCVLHLLSAQRILSFGRLRREEAAALVIKVRAAAGGHAVVDMSNLLMAYASNLIARATFGDDERWFEDGGELRRVFSDFGELLGVAAVGEFIPWLQWVERLTGAERKLARTAEALAGIVERVIEGRRCRRTGRCAGGAEEKAFVDVLLEVNETDEEVEIKFDDAEKKAIMLDMFAAGTSTSYAVMEWTMAELMNNPHKRNKLQQEIRTVVGKDKHITEEHLQRMGYLKLVIKESLRLHSPIPLLAPRETIEDTELLGYHVPARTRVLINAWAIARDEGSWERPEEFRPERFADVATDYKGQDFQLIPFGAGRRGCPGIGFAMTSIELALTNLMYHFNWELPDGMRPGSLDMTEEGGISAHMKYGLHLVAKPYYAV